MRPITYEWREGDFTNPETGEAQLLYAMLPLLHNRQMARKQFGDGGKYTLEPSADPELMKGHVPYITIMIEYWRNLPDHVQFPNGLDKPIRWPTANHFRKWCLIECRYFEQRHIACESAEHAKQTAVFCRELDEYARISINENVVVFRRAKSQSPKKTKMSKDELRQSRKDVEDLASSFVGVTGSQMRKHAGRSA